MEFECYNHVFIQLRQKVRSAGHRLIEKYFGKICAGRWKERRSLTHCKVSPPAKYTPVIEKYSGKKCSGRWKVRRSFETYAGLEYARLEYAGLKLFLG